MMGRREDRRAAARIAAAALVLTALLLATANDPSDGQLRTERLLPLSTTRPISQTFPVVTDGLAAVLVPLRIAHPGDAGGATLVMSLREVAVGAGATGSREGEPGGGSAETGVDSGATGTDARATDANTEVSARRFGATELSQWRVPVEDLGEGGWRAFSLPHPLLLRLGQSVVLEAWLEGPPNEGPHFSGDGSIPADADVAVLAWTSTGDAYPAGRLRVAGTALAGDLAFKVEYRPGRLAKLRWLLASTGFPPPVAGALVYGVVASGLCAVFALWRVVLAPT